MQQRERARSRVVIIGAGFGGLQAALGLANSEVDVWLIDRQNYHLFQPLLYQVATATQNEEAIVSPVRLILRRARNVKFVLAEVNNIRLDDQIIDTTSGPIFYDYLIVAAGAQTNYFGNEHIEQYSFDLKRLRDAVELRNQILAMFERASVEITPEARQRFLSFVIVGGGPTGVEFAGALSELVKIVLENDYEGLISPAEVSITLLEAMDKLLLPFPAPLQAYAQHRLEEMGVQVRLGAMVTDVTEDEVILKDGTRIPSRTLLWAAGVKASGLADHLPVEKARGGRVIVSPELTVPGYETLYVIGDMAYLEQDGAPLPAVATTAMQMGRYAAEHIRRREKDQTSAPFRYVNKGQMAVIGRGHAVADARGWQLKALPAWLAWLFVHVYYLIGFQNRLVVMLNWGFDYLFFERKLRLITPFRDGEVLEIFTEAEAEEALRAPL